jgi:hypothetical protein
MDKWTEQSFLKGRSPNDQKTHEEMFTILAIKEMQIKIALWFHLTPGRMVTIKNTTNNKWQQGYGEKGTLIHCW